MAGYLDLDRTLTPEQVTLRKEVHRFAEEVLRPASVELDRLADPEDVVKRDSIFWDVFRKFYEQGYHTRTLPEGLGGTGLSVEEQCIVTEELGWGSADFAIGLGVTSFPFLFAAGTGNPEIMNDVVRPFLEDREARYVGCWAITEPHHGSDTLAAGTEGFRDPNVFYEVTARADGDEWVINGQKAAWVSNGTIATHALTFLGIEDKKGMGMAGGGVALIPLGLPGISRGRALDKLGQRALNQGEIFFDGARIPRHYMIVGPEGYQMVLEGVLAGANAYMGITFAGLARAAFEEALAYTKQRVQGGRPICEHQLVQKKLFDMFIKVQAARDLARSTLIYNSSGPSAALQCSIASKVFCTTVAFEVASDAVQLFGGYGLAKGVLVEKLLRDARASMIEDGSNDLLSLVGARKIIDG
ncbi:MAG: acyl-CoA dehydrogenase [Chloroflexi bacterium RBG_16_68_14]|nr:MAG: acyl-CoA dehydrogenase [Chloroflexi bacterium RBG_16_68_14]